MANLRGAGANPDSRDEVYEAARLLRRCTEITRVLVEQFTILETMLPTHFLAFRGKLELTLKTFLPLVLKNSTDVNLARVDVYLAADQITAAEAPFDPTLSFGFNTLRSVSPEASQISGAPTLST